MSAISLNNVLDELEIIKNQQNDNNCGICSIKLIPEDTVRLDCHHEYHYECIYNWYKKTIQNTSCSSSSKRRECPYCRKPGGYLPIKKEYEKEIHSPKYASKNKITKISNPIIANNNNNNNGDGCNALTKAGNPCKFKGHYDGYCHIHKSVVNKNAN